MLTGTWLQENEKVQTVKVLAVAEELEALKNKRVQRQIAVIKTPQFWEYRRNDRKWGNHQNVKVDLTVDGDENVNGILGLNSVVKTDEIVNESRQARTRSIPQEIKRPVQVQGQRVERKTNSLSA